MLDANAAGDHSLAASSIMHDGRLSLISPGLFYGLSFFVTPFFPHLCNEWKVFDDSETLHKQN